MNISNKLGGWFNMKQEKWGHVIKITFGFTGIYILFSIIFNVLAGALLQTIFDDLLPYRDSTIILTSVLYFIMISAIFIWIGQNFSNRVSKNPFKRLIYILPISLLGLIIWYSTFDYTRGFDTEFGDFPWLGYSIYIYWAIPALNSLKHYINNDLLTYIGAIPSILPGVMFLLGIWLNRFKSKKVKLSIGVVTGVFLLAIILSAVIPKDTYFKNETYPKVDGATAAIPFGQELVQELSGASVPKSKELVNFNKSHGAYVNLIEKRADIIFVSGPSEDELELAKANNVELKLTPIGKDAFVFLVHNQNKIDNLSVQQIKDIYMGKITNWSEVGGDNDEITAYQRNENSGSQTFMQKQVMAGSPMSEPLKKRMVTGMAGLIDVVAEYKNSEHSIGYSFYYFANEMHKSENIKFLSINGIPVNKETIISGEYPFTATLYAVTREGEPEDSPAHKLLAWILSDQGSKAIERGGFVPIH